MMKFLFPIISLFLAPLVFGQTESKHHIAVFSGLSLPIGSFAASQIRTGKVGYAGPGGILAIAWMPKINNQWRARIAVQYQAQLLADGKAEKAFNQLALDNRAFVSPGISQPIELPPGQVYPNWVFNNSFWSIWHLRGGVQREIQLNSRNKIMMQLHAIAGAVIASSPNMEGKSITDTARAFFFQKTNTGMGFSYQLGTSLAFHLTSHLQFTAGICWDGSSALPFNKTKTTINIIHSPSQQTMSYFQSSIEQYLKQPINTLSLQGGFVWML